MPQYTIKSKGGEEPARHKTEALALSLAIARATQTDDADCFSVYEKPINPHGEDELLYHVRREAGRKGRIWVELA